MASRISARARSAPGRAFPGEGGNCQPVTGNVEGTGEGLGAGPVGVGDGLGPVGLGDGLVLVGVGEGLPGDGDGDGPVLVGVGVGDGLVLVGVGVGDGLVLVGVGDGLVGVGVGDGLVLVGVGVGVGVVHAGTVMVSSSRVTAPLRASARPWMVSPVVTVIDSRARMLPSKMEPVPSVAELPTCQNTLQAWAPFVSRMWLDVSVMSVEPTWKMKTAPEFPCAFRTSSPPTSSDDVALYTPGESDWPAPMKPPRLAAGVRPAASLYAVVKSDCAPDATPSVWCTVPLTMPGGKPVIAVPGLTPRSPLSRLGPVLVTVLPASTAKLPAVPRPTGATAAPAVDWVKMSTAMAAMSTKGAPSQA